MAGSSLGQTARHTGEGMTRFWFILGMWLTSLAAWCINKSIKVKGVHVTPMHKVDL